MKETEITNIAVRAPSYLAEGFLNEANRCDVSLPDLIRYALDMSLGMIQSEKDNKKIQAFVIQRQAQLALKQAEVTARKAKAELLNTIGKELHGDPLQTESNNDS